MIPKCINMKKMIFLALIILKSSYSFCQEDSKSLIAKMNHCIKSFSADQANALNFYTVSGMLEQKQASLIQRISIAEIVKLQVEVSKIGYSVTLSCSGNNTCISLVKSDMSTSTMGSTAFFFSTPAAANSFATTCQQLIQKTRRTDVAGELILFKDANGQTPLLSSESFSNNVGNTQSSSVTPSTSTQSKPNENKEKTIKEIQEEEQEEPLEKEKLKTKESKSKNKNEETESSEEDTPSKKSTNKSSKSKRVTKKEENEDSEPVEEPQSKSRKEKRNERQESNNIEIGDEQTGKKDLCDQLLVIVKSGLENKFKDIEGKETNTEKKINESKIKIKGARKTYLSWFNSKRALIAELKLVDDNDFAIEEFQNLQNQLDECLAGWDDEDHSMSPIYESINYEVKDVEYSNPQNPSSPTIRIAIASEGKKFILFLRIQ